MKKSVLNDKWILVIDHHPAVLMALERNPESRPELPC